MLAGITCTTSRAPMSNDTFVNGFFAQLKSHCDSLRRLGYLDL
jgi:hypothetical protein